VWTSVERDEPADPRALEDLLDTIKVSPCLSIINGWLAEADKKWSPRKRPTIANYERSRAAYWLASIIADAPEDADDATFDELVRAILAASMPGLTDVDATAPVGTLIGVMTAAEAAGCADRARGFSTGGTPLTFADDGLPIVA
jgi:hypothetical protein